MLLVHGMSPRGRSRLVDTPERITVGGKPSALPRRMDDEFASLGATSGYNYVNNVVSISRAGSDSEKRQHLSVTRFNVNPESTSTLSSQAYINYVYEATRASYHM